jgi:hypothetical protein
MTDFTGVFELYSQPLAGNVFSSTSYLPAWNEGGCDASRTHLCTTADVMVLRNAQGITQERKVAYTGTVGQASHAGSTTVSGRIKIIGISQAPVGPLVDKVGARTGWTRGYVAATCNLVYFNIPQGFASGDSLMANKCTNQVNNAFMGLGDSGGAVFWPPSIGQSGGYEAGALGILMGGNVAKQTGLCLAPCSMWYSPWGAIESVLGAIGGGIIPY